MRNPSLLLFQQKIILTQSTKQRNNKHPIKKQIKNIKTDTVKSLDKSRFTQRTDKENTVDKSRSIPRSNDPDKSTRIENPS